ncbi:T9SS type A sorting domain-containing protein [Flavobacteriales bacterium]|nr:T9SS type A sorting domain-containing protein [Flavobacteriales bacterium]
MFSVDSVQIVECDTFVSVSGNLLTESGIYFDTIPNVLGCDSIVQTVLSVLYIDLTLDLDNNIFVSSNETDPAAEYTWINCLDGSVIEGENSPNFVATELGEYACIISMLNCTKTTDCIEVTSLDTTSSDSTISIDELNSFTSVKVYPNPSRGEFKIEMEDYFDGATLNIFNAVGQVVHSQKIKDSVTTVDLNATERGLYFISIKSENKIYRSRIIID